ncbi:MAG: restriction endonuclease subunit R [Microcoleus vaginatus WJT46-NPBG5]|jgi:predicted type IV restriction endonuclease|nr:restriction endonuclease subunit R [Microcoleus vaginatus WJT46-NPBG5]
MVQAIPATNLSLEYLQEKFNLQRTSNDQFFTEWSTNLVELSNIEKQTLDRVKSNYLHLTQSRPMIESLVQMVVLSPLLDLAGFYQPPFKVEVEVPVQISIEDEDEVVQGRIDVLVLRNQLWVLVIESKRGGLSLEPAMPQALAYMLANPATEKSTFGFITNGSNFIFLKLSKQGTPQYAYSYEFTLRRGNEDFYNVLSILKRLGQLILQ